MYYDNFSAPTSVSINNEAEKSDIKSNLGSIHENKAVPVVKVRCHDQSIVVEYNVLIICLYSCC